MFAFFKSRSDSGYLPTPNEDEFIGYRDSPSTGTMETCSSSFEKPSNSDPTHSLLTQEPTFIPRYFTSFTRLGLIFVIFNLLLFFFSIVLCVGSYVYIGNIKLNKGNALLKAMSYHAPLLDRIDIPLIDITVNGTFLNEANSIYRSTPSAEVDAAWERLSNTIPTAVTKEDILALGKGSPPGSKRIFPPYFNLGDDAYAVAFDVFHQLHCLDTLRRNLIHTFEHYHPLSRFFAPNPNSSSIVTKQIPHMMIEHNMHCVHILQQALTCSPSLEPVALGWMRTQAHPFPDFNIRRKCVDFERVVEWQERNMVDKEMWGTVRRPAGAKEGEINPELVKLTEEREREKVERIQRMKVMGKAEHESEEKSH